MRPPQDGAGREPGRRGVSQQTPALADDTWHQAVLLAHEAKTHKNWMHVWGEGGGSSSRVDGVYADITELTLSCQ